MIEVIVGESRWEMFLGSTMQKKMDEWGEPPGFGEKGERMIVMHCSWSKSAKVRNQLPNKTSNRTVCKSRNLGGKKDDA